ncbi:MAG: hypothetical protein ACI85F_001808, partial [Bacteroidia bacterium]
MINRILYITVLLLGIIFRADAQCPNDNTFYLDLTPIGCPGSNSSTCVWGGEYVTVNVIAGNTYTFSTCGDPAFDTQITLYTSGGAFLAFDDDGCGLQSTITWVATFTGIVNVLVDQFPCDYNFTCITLNIDCAGGGGGCGGGPVCTGPAADFCATACSLGSLNAPVPCPTGTGSAQTWCGTNTGATADNPYTYQLGCVGGGDMPISVPDVWYTFVPTGNSIDISVAGLTNPSIGLWSGGCGGLAGIGCANGAGTANLIVEPVIPGDTYYLQVSGGAVGDVGDFDLSITNSFNCDICLTEASITATPAPTNGFYQNNETVTFCYDLVTWEQQLVNWLHGVQVSFGPGWDQTTLTTNPPAAQGGNGTWSWYNTNVASEAGNGTFPPGFYFESPAHSGGVNSTTNPGDSWGDNGTGGWQFCWTITTQDCPPGVDGADLGISVTTTADGESGDWTSYACSPDPSVDFNGIMTCCPDPILLALIGNDCFSDCLGSATVTGDGTGPYDYSWVLDSNGSTVYTDNGNAGSSTGSNLCSGDYTVTVVDQFNGCTADLAVTITAPTVLVLAQTSLTNETCGNSNGQIVVAASGGTPGYTYDIGGVGQASGTFSGLAAGSYTVTVTDAGPCTEQLVINIVNNGGPTAAITSQFDPNCNGGNDGFFTIVGSGSLAPYTYSTDGVNFGASGTFTGQAAGTYTITVQDAYSCQTTINVTLGEPPILVINVVSVVDATCGLTNGEIHLSGAGGTPPYSFNVGSGAQASGDFTGLGGGVYTATISDVNGCTSLLPVTVNAGNLVANITSQTNILCNGGTGAVTVVASGSTLPYTYDIGSGPQASGTFTGLGPGGHTVTVEDGDGCQLPVNFTITEPNALTGSINGQSNVTCNGDDDGSVTVGGWGGTPPYQYNIGAGNQASGTFSSLAPNNYTVVITDANGCTFPVPVNITEPFAFVLVENYVTNATCELSNGEIQVQGWGGTLPVTFNYGSGWQTGNPHTISGLAPGAYTINAQDGNGCPGQVISTVLNVDEPTVSISAQSDPTCAGVSDGSLTAVGADGVGPYTYSIDGIIFQASGTFAGLAAGSQTVTVEDANGCQETVTVTITDPPGVILAIASITHVSCFGLSTGSATTSASGGTPPYTYDIGSGPQASGVFIGLAAGGYTVTVLDANNCPATIAVTINEQPVLTGTLDLTTDADCNGAATGSLTVSASGGTPPST